MTPKELKQLVKICREMGVKNYKSDKFEFTLSDEAPAKPVKTKSKSQAVESTSSDKIESDSLTAEEMLFWSAVNPTPLSEEGSSQ